MYSECTLVSFEFPSVYIHISTANSECTEGYSKYPFWSPALSTQCKHSQVPVILKCSIALSLLTCCLSKPAMENCQGYQNTQLVFASWNRELNENVHKYFVSLGYEMDISSTMSPLSRPAVGNGLCN